MDVITVKDKQFALSLPSSEILRQVRRVAAEINRDYAGKEPIFLAVLNGSFVFAADLLREVTLPCQIHFVKMTSYEGMQSTGDVREIIGLNTDIEGQNVIVLEDIVDTGKTMATMLEMLRTYNPASVDVCTMMLKPGKLQVNLDIRYNCFEIPDDFIVGYGLDYDGYGRNLRSIYTVVE